MTVPVRRIYALIDTAGEVIPVTALCNWCYRDSGQQLAALEAANWHDMDTSPQFHDITDLPCYICGAEWCEEFAENGSCIHSDHTP